MRKGGLIGCFLNRCGLPLEDRGALGTIWKGVETARIGRLRGGRYLQTWEQAL